MKRLLIACLLIFALVGTALAQDRLTPDQIDEIARTVVYIEAVVGNSPEWTGSGTIIAPEGIIFTNRHVAEGADGYLIYMYESEIDPPVLSYIAQLDSMSDNLDFAILRIVADANGNAITPSGLNLPYLQSSAQQRARRGDSVFVFGYPGIGDGFLQFTTGVITGIQGGTLNGQRVPLLYQTDAEISPGNSGGLAVNAAGEMIGLPTLVTSEERTGGRIGGILPIEAVFAEFNVEPGGNVEEQPPATPEIPTVPGTTLGLDYRLTPNYGVVELAAGFMPDPFTKDMISGATTASAVDIAALNLGADCAGFATNAPDLRLMWTGDSPGIRMFFVGNGDTTLVVNDPTGAWFCNDDSYQTTNPTVQLLTPGVGQYDIWIGSYNASENVTGTFYITELDSVTPVNPTGG